MFVLLLISIIVVGALSTTDSTLLHGTALQSISTAINACGSRPCRNGATCFQRQDAFHCRCRKGFVGNTCERHPGVCDSQPCKNGAPCQELDSDSYQCNCTRGWGGLLCSTNLRDSCTSNPCQNNGRCFSAKDEYHCACQPGFTGDDCGQRFDVCRSFPCKNGATCTPSKTATTFTCNCAIGWDGASCEHDFLEW